jgi:arylsulfatase B
MAINLYLMNRRNFLQTTGLSAAAVAFDGRACFAQSGSPNVVILLADDLGFADVGFHKSEIQTTNLDRLAKQSTEIERFYSFPVCSPTRSALMTGRSPMRLGLGYTVIRPWSDYALPLEEHTIAQAFQSAGYETAMSGKWHLGHASRKYFPSARGFEHSYGHFNGAIDYNTHIRDGGLDWHRNGKTVEEAGYSTELIGTEAVRRIRERNRAKPLFLYVPFNAPHAPLQAPSALIEKYSFIKDERRRTFAAMVEAMDSQIGRILQALDDEKIASNTIVLFFSDNGGPVNQGARNMPLRGAKASTFEGGTRVPALLRWPGKVAAGAKLSQVMTVMDLFPTLAAAAGVQPRNKLPFDGKNLWPVLSGSIKPYQREDLFFSVEANGLYFAVHSGPWKLVQHIQNNRTQTMLFRIHEDPSEEKDLASQNASVVEQLAAKIAEWRKLQPAHSERNTTGSAAGWKPPARYADGARP